MSQLSILTEKVRILTNTFNDFIVGSKQTHELPEQTPIDVNSKIRVTENGVSKWVTIQSILNTVPTSGGTALYLNSHVSLTALQTAHPTAVSGNWALITVDGADDQVAYWDVGASDWFVQSSGGGPVQTTALYDNTKIISTGSTGHRKVKDFIIPANTVPENCTLRLILHVRGVKTVNLNGMIPYLTCNSISLSAKKIVNYKFMRNAPNPVEIHERLILIHSGLMSVTNIANLNTDNKPSNGNQDNIVFDVTQDNLINLWCFTANALDQFIFESISLEIIN